MRANEVNIVSTALLVCDIITIGVDHIENIQYFYHLTYWVTLLRAFKYCQRF